MAQSKWSSHTTEATVLSTELNSLVNGGNKITTTPLSNDGSDELYLYAMLRMTIAAQGTNRLAGANISVYFIPEVGATYAFGGDSLDPPAELLVWSFSFDSGALAARENVSLPITLPPTDFHVLVINNTGQTLASSGNTLKIEKFGIQSVA